MCVHVVPKADITLGANVFEGCYPHVDEDLDPLNPGSGLTAVTLPNSLRIIKDRAFFHCHDLKSITLPESLTTIADSAFSGCYNLTFVSLGIIQFSTRGRKWAAATFRNVCQQGRTRSLQPDMAVFRHPSMITLASLIRRSRPSSLH